MTIDLDAAETVSCTFTNTQLTDDHRQEDHDGCRWWPIRLHDDRRQRLHDTVHTDDLGTRRAPGRTPSRSSSAPAGIGGDYTVIEGIEPGFVLTDVTCVITVAGVAGTTVSGDANTRTGTINDLSAGTTVTCTFINSGALTTRTQGFWATHLSLLSLVWNSAPQIVGGIQTDGMTAAEMTICRR